MSTAHTDGEYINADPFFGDESDLTCRTVTIRKARKAHKCYGLRGWFAQGPEDHEIRVGDRYRYERAMVDGDFWGEYKICLPCMDLFLADGAEDEESEEDTP